MNCPYQAPLQTLLCVWRSLPIVAGIPELALCVSEYIDTSLLWTVEMAIKRGHARLVSRLLTRRTYSNSKELCDVRIGVAAAAGDIDTIKALVGLFPGLVLTCAGPKAATNGQIEILSWLHDRDMYHGWNGHICSEPQQLTAAMDRAAGNWRLDTVEWLHRGRTEGCTVNAMDSAVASGHLHVVERLAFGD
ncbi:hypothetical protein PHMEG_0003149 [Phytophthora megakarya]|uniref:Uncharacterized protein n=1 Tax=Phytophthora megakarya TaxID=4795 RepID=A0A225WXF5_9STRA|nr:hypothetical protein PHMEG_0003149 [Phytophthora megakarya]